MTPDDDPYEVGRLIALKALDRAPRTSGQIRDLLARRGVPDEATHAVVTRLCEVGLIDDRLFASLWVQSRTRTRGSARRALREELRRQRLSDEVIDEALADLSPDDEFGCAVEVLTARLQRIGPPGDPRGRQRLVAQQVRRGHSWGAAERIVDFAIAGAEQVTRA